MGNFIYIDIIDIIDVIEYTTIFFSASIVILHLTADFKNIFIQNKSDIDRQSFRNINTIYFDLNRYEEGNYDLENLFIKAFVCPKTKKIMNYPVVSEDGTSYNYNTKGNTINVIKEDYYNRNLSNLISFFIKNKKTLIKDSELYDKLSTYL